MYLSEIQIIDSEGDYPFACSGVSVAKSLRKGNVVTLDIDNVEVYFIAIQFADDDAAAYFLEQLEEDNHGIALCWGQEHPFLGIQSVVIVTDHHIISAGIPLGGKKKMREFVRARGYTREWEWIDS